MKMNLDRSITNEWQLVAANTVSIRKLLMFGAVALVVTCPSFAQNLEAVQQSMAQNAQKLHQYQWIETTQLTLNGDQKPATQDSCQYGPNGQVQKTPISPPQQQPSGGRLKQRIIEKKKGEMQDYMGEVKGVLSMYVPPDPQKMEQAKQAGNFSLNPVPGAVNLIFTNYAQPGDRMTLTFDTAAKKVVSLNINTYMGESKDTVTLQVQMASLPDGTNYTQQSVLDATAKKLRMTTSNSNYQKLGGY